MTDLRLLSNMTKKEEYDQGTSIIPRYLLGTWKVKHTTDPELYAATLEVESETEASFINMDGVAESISEFKVDEGRILGSFRYVSPRDYAGWLVFNGQHLRGELDLLYVDNKLVGRIVFKQDKPEKTNITPITLSRL